MGHKKEKFLVLLEIRQLQRFARPSNSPAIGHARAVNLLAARIPGRELSRTTSDVEKLLIECPRRFAAAIPSDGDDASYLHPMLQQPSSQHSSGPT
jgi:hypothetical protein